MSAVTFSAVLPVTFASRRHCTKSPGVVVPGDAGPAFSGAHVMLDVVRLGGGGSSAEAATGARTGTSDAHAATPPMNARRTWDMDRLLLAGASQLRGRDPTGE